MNKIKHMGLIVGFFVVSFAAITAQNYKLPEYVKFQLDNGLTVFLMEQHYVPNISVSAIIPAGAITDGDQSGISQLTALALKHGTKKYSKAQIDELLDFVGARVDINASKEYLNVSSTFAAKDTDTVMTIIKELLRFPVFDATEFEKGKSRMLTSIERQKESPRAVIGDYFDKFLYSDHVYGNSLTGTTASVKKITNEDVKRFYAENYQPNHASISIVGDFDTADMKKRINSLFSDWKKGKTTPSDLTTQAIQKPSGQRVLLVNKDDAKETRFYIGAPGVAKNNKDYVALQVVNSLFGGRFTSMLNAELRTNSGLTYGAGSRFNALKNGGTFYISTFTANETTEQAIDLTLEVVKNLHEKGIDAEMLSSARNYTKGQFPPRYETISQLSNLLTEMFWYDFDETFINDFEANVDELTLERANKIISTYFPKDNYQFVLIGKASEIMKIAEKYGQVEQLDIND